MTDLKMLEYRVKEKTVYFVTRHCVVGDEESVGVSTTEEGFFLDQLTAQRAAIALCAVDHCRRGLPDDDPRIVPPAPLTYSGDPLAG